MLYRKVPAQPPRLLLKIAAAGVSAVAVACSGAAVTPLAQGQGGTDAGADAPVGPECNDMHACGLYPMPSNDASAPSDASTPTCGDLCGIMSYPSDAHADAGAPDATGPCGDLPCGVVVFPEAGHDAAGDDAEIVGSVGGGIVGIGPAGH